MHFALEHLGMLASKNEERLLPATELSESHHLTSLFLTIHHRLYAHKSPPFEAHIDQIARTQLLIRRT